MQFRLPLLACAVSMTMAKECGLDDMSPFVEAMTNCVKSISLTKSELANPDAPTLAKICGNSDCKTYLAKLQGLTCTVNGRSPSAQASICDSVSSANYWAVGSIALVVSTVMLVM